MTASPGTSSADRSILADLVGWFLICVLTVLPALVAWRLGSDAETAGDRRGRAPRLVGAVLATVVVVGPMVRIAVNAMQGRY